MDSELGGCGVFLFSFIEKGLIIEIVLVLVILGFEWDFLDKIIIYDYYFIWGL